MLPNKKSCCFFSQTVVPQEIEPTLRSTLIRLFETKGVNHFYLFLYKGLSFLALDVLMKLRPTYPHSITVVVGGGELGGRKKRYPDKKGILLTQKEITSLTQKAVSDSRFVITYFPEECVAKAELYKTDLFFNEVISLEELTANPLLNNQK